MTPQMKALFKLTRDPMTAGFVHQAVTQFAQKVVKTPAEKITEATNGMVSGQAWIDIAEEVLEALKYEEEAAA